MEKSQNNTIPFLSDLDSLSSEQRIDLLKTKGFEGLVNQVNWAEYAYQPAVNFRLAHNNQHLFILFNVDEKNIKATYLKDNDPVWQDSCVEAFISPKGDNAYFNFEFSCIGTALGGYGEGRGERLRLNEGKMKLIQRESSLGHDIVGKENVNAQWWLMAQVPFDLIQVEKGQAIRCNFYKCGDETKEPHFLSWQPIDTPKPDFHQPKFFGELVLE